GDITRYSSRSVSISTRVDAAAHDPGDVLSNTATFTADQSGPVTTNTATVTVVSDVADVGVSQSLDGASNPIEVNATPMFIANVYDNGPADAHNPTLIDTMAPGYGFVSATRTDGK